MGGNTSVVQGNIYLKTDKAVYYAGETVTGTIYLQLQGNYSGSSLVLKVKGREETQFTSVHSSDRAGQRNAPPLPHKGRNYFYNHRIPIYVWNSGFVPAGQYAFPFSFALSSYIPGTFNLDDIDMKAKIFYRLKAELEPMNRSEQKALKFTQELVIRESVRTNITAMHGEMNREIRTWGCLTRGTSYIRCYFEKNAYGPGEVANIICEVDNSNCRLPIRRIIFSLKAKVSLRDDRGRTLEKTITILTQEFSGLGPHEVAMGESRRIAAVALENHNLRGPIQATTNGQLIRCSYTLNVVSDVDGCLCCTIAPHVEVPVTIYAPECIVQQIAPPQNWEPQQMPVMNIVLNESYSYQSKNGMNKTNEWAPRPDGNQMARAELNLGALPPPPGQANIQFGNAEYHKFDNKQGR